MNTIFSDIAEIKFNEADSILYVRMMDSIEINIENIKNHYEIINQLTGAKKHTVIIDATNYFYIKDDALKYMAAPPATNNTIATAFYSGNLANRLSILCLKLYYPKSCPLHYFTKKESALEWLTQIQYQANTNDKGTYNLLAF